MKAQLIREGKHFVLQLDETQVQQLGLDALTDGESTVIQVSRPTELPSSDFERALLGVDEQYSEVFRRLADA